MAFQILAGTAIINKGRVLLVQQKHEGPQADRWGPPAGHADGKENPIETAIRETKEETNLDIEILGISQSGIFKYKGADYALVFYAAKAKNLSNLKIQENEVADFKWASLEDLQKDKYKLRKKFLKEPLIASLTQKPSSINKFKIYFVEKD